METQCLSDICEYRKGKVAVGGLSLRNYISTENLVPNKGGIIEASGLPDITSTQEYKSGDVLVSNIRPYFKKIWHAKTNGGCSNDVLVFTAKPGIDPLFLYYVLADDKFFDFSMASSKGTKMPRGDKSAIMNFCVPKFDLNVQRKIGQFLRNIDDKISINTQINGNLSDQAKALFKNMFPSAGKLDEANGVLADIATITMGQSPDGKSYNEEGAGAIFYQGRTEFGDRFPSVRLFTTEPKRIYEEVSKIRRILKLVSLYQIESK